MPRRKRPLGWMEVSPDLEPLPDCRRCLDFLWQPGMAEAIASVGIEMPVNVKRLVEQYHEGGHRDG